LHFAPAARAALTFRPPCALGFMLKVFTYAKCSTCQKAVAWLQSRGIAHKEVAIKEAPPSVPELRAMLKARGSFTKLSNSSGIEFRALGMKEKLTALPETEALALLAGNGMLIRRPFALDEKRGVFLTGFREPEWQAALG